MHTKDKGEIEGFLADVKSVSHCRHETLTHIRHLFLSRQHSLTEGIKYGGLVFFKNDQLIGGIFAYKNHISVEFGRGAELPDTRKVLEGKGKFRRHIKIHNRDEIHQKNLQEYINAIIELHVS